MCGSKLSVSGGVSSTCTVENACLCRSHAFGRKHMYTQADTHAQTDTQTHVCTRICTHTIHSIPLASSRWPCSTWFMQRVCICSMPSHTLGLPGDVSASKGLPSARENFITFQLPQQGTTRCAQWDRCPFAAIWGHRCVA